MSRSIKAELAEGPVASSPTHPNTSSRAQTINSFTPTPIERTTPNDTPASIDSDATMANSEHAAMYSLGADSHQLIQVIKKLEQLNIDATLPSLPKFVVVGDQSAGKSSVVEALCDISLPRGQGTCTRCPFLITTSSQRPLTGTWQCSVSIKKEFWFDDRVTTGQFYPLKPPVISHFVTVHDKSELETVLRRAQLAVLNPRQEPERFINADVTASHPLQVEFSPNVICLEIQGPDLPELSFYDLPGAINVIEDGQDQSLVQWIEGLVCDYVRDEKTLILLACGADQDVNVVTSFRWLKNCKAEHRTVGVLTKVDLLSQDRMKYIQDIMCGKFSLGRGWFATKQLSQEEIKRGVDARKREADLFNSEPWASFPGDLQQRFGIPKLQEAVSRSLTDHIRGELPEILGRVGDRLSEINKQLVLFPDRPTLPTYTVITEINKLSATISNHVRGNEDVNLFRREVEDIILDLKKQLIDAKPTFDWKTPGWKAPSLSLISDDEEMPDATPTPLPQRRAPIVTPTTTRKRNAEATPSSQRRVKKEPSAPTVQKQKHTLEGLRAEYDCGRTSSVPSAINPKVTDRLSLQALSSWDVIVDRMLQSMTAKILSQIQDSIAQDLAGWHATRFFARTTEVLTAFVHRLMQDETNEVKRLLACEQYRPITYSKWTALNGARVRDFEAARRLQRTKEWFETHEADKAKATPNDKRAEKARDLAWAQANLGDDEYQKLLECAATIAAYYDTASMCFIDTVAKNLEFGVMRPLRDEVLSTLSEELRAGDVDECTMLLAEDPQREAERAKLMAEKERLEKALAELNGLGA